MRKKLLSTVAVWFAMSSACCALSCSSDNKVVKNDPVPVVPTAVNAQSIKIESETVNGTVVTWDAVDNAEWYDITVNGVENLAFEASVNLDELEGYVRPSDGTIDFGIIVTAYDESAGKYVKSDLAETTLTLQGVILNSPEIEKIDNGIISWGAVEAATAYSVKVDGVTVSDGADGYYHVTSLDLKAHPGSVVSVAAVCTDSSYYKESDETKIGVNESLDKLMLMPVTNYKVQNSVLSWAPVGGASGYRVVDVKMNTAAIIAQSDAPQYDMTGKNMVYGVYPISSNKLLASAEISPVDIDYLEGEGTVASPYLIKTPFDLRAIDYYETRYAEKKKVSASIAANVYKLQNDINFNAVAAGDSESNFYTLSAPFFGILDGNFKKFSNVRVAYDGGYWAMFDFIAAGGTVRNITFDNPEITNDLLDNEAPIGAVISAVANINYGTIRGITLADANFSAAGGEVCGICAHNYGIVTKCEVTSAVFTQRDTGLYSQACYEMAGVVLENYGTVSDNVVTKLDIRGNESHYLVNDKPTGSYNNVRTVGGIVAVNRKGGTVSNNSYGTVNMIRMVDDYGQKKDDNGNYGGYEFGGIVGYNAGMIIKGTGKRGTMTWSDSASIGGKITREVGSTTDHDLRGTVVGKSDGQVK